MATATITTARPAPITYPAGLPDACAPLGRRATGRFRTLAVVAGAAGVVLAVGVSSTRGSSSTRTCSGTYSPSISRLGALFWVLIHHVSDAGWSVGPAARVREHHPGDHATRGAVRAGADSASSSGTYTRGTSSSHGPEPSEEHLARRGTSRGCTSRRRSSSPASRSTSACGSPIRSRCETGPPGRIRSAAQPSRRNALVGAVWRAASRLTIDVLRVRRADEPAVHVVQHDLRRVLLGRRHPREHGDLSCWWCSRSAEPVTCDTRSRWSTYTMSPR